jgi:hypothetical protein
MMRTKRSFFDDKKEEKPPKRSKPDLDEQDDAQDEQKRGLPRLALDAGRTEHPIISSEQYPLKHWVIVGAGPVGLAYALHLKNKNVGKILLIDPRMGDYTRSGDFVDEVFDDLSDLLGTEVQSSYANHIKDCENALLSEIQLDPGPITLLNARFKNFLTHPRKHIVITQLIQGRGDEMKAFDLTIPCDVFVDCTGTARVGINAMNALFPAPVFRENTFVTLPHSTYLYARITMSQRDRRDYSNRNKQKPPAIPSAAEMAPLLEMGWPYADVIPNNYINSDSDRDKINFYTEAPDCLKTADEKTHLEWARRVIALEAKRQDVQVELIKPSQNTNKKRTAVYSADSKYVTPAYHLHDIYPILFHGGDASCNIPFIFGVSTRRSIDQLIQMGVAIEVDEDEVLIDLNKYAENLKDIKPELREIIDDEIKTIWARFNTRLAVNTQEVNDDLQTQTQEETKEHRMQF